MAHSSHGNPWPFKASAAVPVTIRQYVSREQLSLSCPINKTPSYRALVYCDEWEKDTGLNVTSLFWATQTRPRQGYFCAPILRPAPDVPRHLCVKCGRWISPELLPLHLPIEEIKLFMLRRPARTLEVLDATNQCLSSDELPFSFVEDHTLRLKYLEQEDWPAICPNCRCVVMWTFLQQHCSNPAYCKHAALSRAISSGHLTRNRFNWYPGHPMVHLCHVGRWTTLSLVGLHHKSRSSLHETLRPFLVLYALASNNCFDVCAATVMDFSGIALVPATSDATFLFQTINEGRLGLAWWTFRFMIKQHLSFFRSNIFGFL